MKALLVVLALSSFSLASHAETVLYCGGSGVEGAYIKVQPTLGTMCFSAGPWGENYCDSAQTKFEITQTRKGSLDFSGRSFDFREFVGTSGTEIQVVRVFNEASNPTGADVTMHRADLIGSVTLLNNAAPNVEALDGDASCMQGDDSSF